MYSHCCEAKQLHNAEGKKKNDSDRKVLDSGKQWIIHTLGFESH